MTGTVHIQVGRFDAKVHSPFEAKDVIKDLPRTWRRWDKGEKCWIVELHAVDSLKSSLRMAGFTVQTTHQPGSERRYSSPPPRAERNPDTWADSMYRALGKTLGDKAYKALVPVLHPDRGGDTVSMQQLNAARDKAKLQPTR
ncbi:hypothetical protein [Streptomyces sp. NPDC007264]|uniref:hypothetical protein n=1 Tax=Streptomyces sp. NPDC007264 TaxID=3364777 RepID=UPI0036DF3364